MKVVEEHSYVMKLSGREYESLRQLVLLGMAFSSLDFVAKNARESAEETDSVLDGLGISEAEIDDLLLELFPDDVPDEEARETAPKAGEDSSAQPRERGTHRRRAG